MPPAADVHCRYAAEWTGTKLRWNLTVGGIEHAALNDLASVCPDQTVTYTPAT